ncbi:nuclear transport factor 2 family protein [Pseudomonas rustica]|jgi:hypothetical protein|uniref:nuclear transport factor 2 family protein n=1 Tax=Pseudomonas rustica TaxID=2827099 RepID=UPI001BAF1760|nr:nuclear transport factor 2 family protein [Pseudomonas rustica]MBS4089815.1 nuclear transport factor 2 family protein [Pseudomonas rustica]
MTHKNQANAQDISEISQLLLNWGFFRDHKMWDELRSTFVDDGIIHLTWYVGSIQGFVEGSKAMSKSPVKTMHVMKPSIVDVNGDRAIAITPASIMARAEVASPGLDLTSEALFYDFIVKDNGIWKISRRYCIYQKDRLDSIEPSLVFWFKSLWMDTSQFDPAYKYLGFMLGKSGFAVQPGQYVDNTEPTRQLYAEGKSWLAETPTLQLA